MIKQIRLPLRGRPILLITRMITDQIGLHSVLLPLLIEYEGLNKMMFSELFNQGYEYNPLSPCKHPHSNRQPDITDNS